MFKPLNPIDVSLRSRQPREPYNIFERLQIILIALKKKKLKLSFLYFLNFIKFLIIQISILIYYPLILLVYFFKIRFVVINYWQFGTIAQHLVMLKMDLENRNLNSKLFYVYLPKKFSSSKDLILILKRDVNIVSNHFLYLILIPFFHSKLTRFSILKYDEHSKFSESQKIYKNFYKKNKTLLSLDKKKNDICAEIFFNMFKFSSKKNFAILHIRTDNFYSDDYKNRNSKIEKYNEAISFLLKKNFQIIVSSSDNNVLNYSQNFKNKIHILDHNKYINKKISTQFFQIYCLINCKFLICNNSGIKNFAQQLGSPCLIIDAFPFHSAFGYGNKDISIPKILVENGKKINFSTIIKSDQLFYGFANADFKIVENSNKDILLGVQDMYDSIVCKKKIKDILNVKNLNIRPQKYSLGKISPSFLMQNSDINK